MFKCDNCFRSMETGTCNLSVREADQCMLHNFVRYDEKIEERLINKQQRSIIKLIDAVKSCQDAGLNVYAEKHKMRVVDAALLQRLTGTSSDTGEVLARVSNNPRVVTVVADPFCTYPLNRVKGVAGE